MRRSFFHGDERSAGSECDASYVPSCGVRHDQAVFAGPLAAASSQLRAPECIEHLRARDRELIRQRYAAGESGKDLAENIGRPANSVYQSLGRIRRTLLECIQRRMATAS